MKDLYRLLRLFQPYYAWLALGVFLSLITLLANVALMALSGQFITAMAVAGAAGVTINYFTPAALIRTAAIVRTGGRYAERLVTHEATFRLLSELRVWFYQHLEPLAPAGLAAYRSGDLLSRIRADIDTLNNIYLRLFVPVIVAILSSIIFVIFLTFYNPLLALIEFTLLFIAGVIVPWIINIAARPAGKQVTQLSSNIRETLVSDIQGMGELLIYGADAAHAEHLSHLSKALANQQQTMSRLTGISQAMLGLSASLAMWLVIIVTIPMVTHGEQPPANLAMLALFTLASFEAVIPLPFAFQSLGETLTAARRIFSITDQQATIKEPKKPLILAQPIHIKFKHISLRYTAEKPMILSDVSVEIKPCNTLAIVGLTSSGKSSLINLLLRFYPASGGQILVNDQPIEHYNSDELRSQLSVVAQDNHLFNTTIRENLLLAKPNATQTELESVCRLVQLHDFIIQQPESYETIVGEIGVRLSGGQTQRLTLARALLKPASLLILDEPTEGLDPQTAKAVLTNIYHRTKQQKQSLVMITHNLQGLQAMDQIMVLNEGKMIESGKHEDLLKNKQLYQKLYENNQTIY